MDRGFQCYAYARGGRWQAICTDLDIAVDGASRRAVEDSLATALDMYLEWVSELPREEQARFLARRAPWYVRLEMAALTRIGLLIGGGERSRRFVLQSHLPVRA